MRYREDIDGLRAIAVLAVVLFHLDLGAFAGGYVGVDVFFVISGFLITTIVARDVEAGRFSLRRFYSRRVRRLVPPLLATVLATSVGAALLFVPLDMAAYGRSAVAALLSVANVVFFAEAGYWDASTELKPLLHTWSLGVEEQFYAFWPLLVIGLVRLRGRVSMLRSLGAITVVGFALSLWSYAISPEAAFYLLPARVYQFSVGALVAHVPSRRAETSASGRRRDAVALVGVGAILLAVLTFDESTPFPGVPALLPTLGTVLVIAAGTGGVGRVASALGHPFARWLGTVSYAMYLVHWPLISLYRYATDGELDAVEQVGLAAATVLATLVLHHGVERRFYSRAHTTVAPAGPTTAAGSPTTARTPIPAGSPIAARTLAFSAVTALVLAHPWLGDGWAWRTPDASLSVVAIETGVQARFTLTGSGCSIATLDDPERCDLGRPHQVIVFGNSHEPDGYNFLVGAYGDRADVNLISFGGTNGCDLARADGVWRAADERCDDRIRALFDPAFLSSLDMLVYTANQPFSANKEVFLRVLSDLAQRAPDVEVVALGGYINTTVPCARLVNEHGTPDACAAAENVTYWGRAPEQDPLYDEFMRVADRFVDRRALLCDDPDVVESCRTRTADGVPVSYDEHHLSLEFALEAGALFAESEARPLLPPASTAPGSA